MLLIQLDENNIMINIATAERNDRPDVFITAPEGTTVDDLGKRWTGSAWEDVHVPEPEPVEPTPEELNNLALMEGIAGLYETQIALENRMVTDNLTVMEGIAGLFEAQMGGI